MTGHKTLFVVEGYDEEKFLKRMFKAFNISNEYDMYVYEANIHKLIDCFFDGDDIDYDLDTLMSLKEEEDDDEKKKMLSMQFENIYFVFDLDPQDKKIDYEKISMLLDFLNDPTDNGKLYINYPMLESYKHMTSLHDENFKDRMVETSVIKKYKEIVDKECHNDFKQNANYNNDCFIKITKMHLMKMNYILNGDFEMMSENEFLKSTGSDVFHIQCESIRKDNNMFVLNTSVFIVPEYKPSLFFNNA